jgi:L-lactate utilization protein LutB
VAEEIEKQTAADYAAMKQEQMALRKRMSDELHEVEQLREGLKSTHAKVAALLETLIDLPIAKAMVQDQDGNMVLDHTLISDKDAKVALSAAEKILKVTGAMVPPKVEVDLGGGNAFDLLDAVEVDAEDA